MMLLSYPLVNNHINISEPSWQQLQNAIEHLQSEYQPELLFAAEDWKITIAIDNNNERVQLCYWETDPKSAFYGEFYVVDTTIKDTSKSKSIDFTMANGEEYSCGLYKTITKDMATKVVQHFYEEQSIPNWIKLKPVLSV